ncbi:MAG: site-specific recombinase [Bacteroidetes bacterium]|nr:site-specific recombinase [Bacteroidota bacterium]
MILQKKNKRDFIDIITRRSTVLHIADKDQGLDFLVSFFSAVRPSSQKGKNNATQNLDVVIREMHEHPVLLKNLQHALLSQLINTDLSPALTESGIPLARGFWQELFGRCRHKLLPALQSKNDFLYVINRVFFRKNDYQWVEAISYEKWIIFFESMRLAFHVDDRRILHQLIQSLKILAFQVAQLSLEKEVFQYLPEQEREKNPFIGQNYLIHDLEKMLNNEDGENEMGVISSALRTTVQQCYDCIEYIRKNHSSNGTSLHQTYTLVLLENKLDRINILVDILDGDQYFDTGKFVSLFKMLVRNENRKNSIREFLSQCLGYLAYQIAEHKGSKGNKYITSSPGEYRAMMGSAMNGGLVICFVAIIKNLLTKMEMPFFWHGFAYSVNYSIGFVVIEETHSTLATKQPAFTASAVASSLDTKQNTHQPNLYNLAITVAKVSRSQIASFIGNLVIVFPGTYLLAWLYHLVTKTKIIEGEAATKLLEAQHPWHSLSLLYACNTGFFLFLSGIIAGYVQNSIQYGHFAERLRTHPLLRLSFSPERLNRIAVYIEKHTGAIVGNVSLGFMLGMSGLVVGMFGIPFDIRHITISAGNVATAVYGIGIANINPYYLLTVILGVLGIGFFNFLISFSLAFIVAVKSRGVHLKDYPEFVGILWRYFKKRPLDFIRPRKQAEPEF